MHKVVLAERLSDVQDSVYESLRVRDWNQRLKASPAEEQNTGERVGVLWDVVGADVVDTAEHLVSFLLLG